MKPRIRSRRPASIGSNQPSPASRAGRSVLSSCMAWSPPACHRRSWLGERAGDYAAPDSNHIRDGTSARAVVRDLTEPDRPPAQKDKEEETEARPAASYPSRGG